MGGGLGCFLHLLVFLFGVPDTPVLTIPHLGWNQEITLIRIQAYILEATIYVSLDDCPVGFRRFLPFSTWVATHRLSRKRGLQGSNRKDANVTPLTTQKGIPVYNLHNISKHETFNMYSRQQAPSMQYMRYVLTKTMPKQLRHVAT